MYLYKIHFIILNIGLCYVVFATIDLNINELQYLASRLKPFECRKLVAMLHYTSYELPETLASAERRINDEIPCLELLLHWNGSPEEGKGNTHEAIVHRLRQLKRNDLADWLGRTTFKQLSKDVERAFHRPFGKMGEQETETAYPITIEPIGEFAWEDSSIPIDTILMAILLGLFGTLLILIGALIVQKIKSNVFQNQYRKFENDENTEDLHEGE